MVPFAFLFRPLFDCFIYNVAVWREKGVTVDRMTRRLRDLAAFCSQVEMKHKLENLTWGR